MTVPTQKLLEATVKQLEEHVGASKDVRAKVYLSAYQTMSKRFAKDLSDPRDVALSRASALMLLKLLLAQRR